MRMCPVQSNHFPVGIDVFVEFVRSVWVPSYNACKKNNYIFTATSCKQILFSSIPLLHIKLNLDSTTHSSNQHLFMGAMMNLIPND